jgi:putative oxidoreductase
MNTILWIAQMGLAAIFFYAGIKNLLAFQKHDLRAAAGPSFQCIGVSAPTAFAIGFTEILGAIGLVIPLGAQEPYLVAQLSAGVLAVLLLAACIYHARRKEHTSPIVGLFFLAIFVIVGRMH